MQLIEFSRALSIIFGHPTIACIATGICSNLTMNIRIGQHFIAFGYAGSEPDCFTLKAALQ
jgi:hypothetical protein